MPDPVRLTVDTITDDQLDELHAQLEEARMWARHGYEIGQRHCGWTDHGVAPAWLTEGWPTSFDTCGHLAGLYNAETRVAMVRALHANDFGLCRECTGSHGVPWPCPTIRALEGQEPTE